LSLRSIKRNTGTLQKLFLSQSSQQKPRDGRPRLLDTATTICQNPNVSSSDVFAASKLRL